MIKIGEIFYSKYQIKRIKKVINNSKYSISITNNDDWRECIHFNSKFIRDVVFFWYILTL